MDVNYIKVTIIIPTYKRWKLLARAIDSVLCQTHKNIELIVIDDNISKSDYATNTKKVVENYCNDKRVIYYKNEKNLGCALARNEGIRISTGEYITFLDDDDIYLPRKIEKQLQYMVDNDLDMSFSDLRLYNEHNRLVDYRAFDDISKLSQENLKKYHLMRHLTGTDTFMYKRSFLLCIGGFDGITWGDEFHLMYKTICNTKKIGYINESFVIAFVHQGEGVSKGEQKISGENEMYMFKKTHFNMFTVRERMFIRFRHYAVLAVTYLRSRNIILALKYALISLFVSPVDFIVEPIKLIKKIVINRKRFS